MNMTTPFGFFYLKSNVFWSIRQQSLNLRICWFYTFSFKMYMPPKKSHFGKKAKEIMFNMGQIVIESQEPLNPRDIDIEYR